MFYWVSISNASFTKKEEEINESFTTIQKQGDFSYCKAFQNKTSTNFFISIWF